MDMENQAAIKRLVDENGADNVVVVIGAADLEGAEITAETVTAGDPGFAGPLSGVSLRLPVYHILEPEVKKAIPTDVYEEQDRCIRRAGWIYGDGGRYGTNRPKIQGDKGAPAGVLTGLKRYRPFLPTAPPVFSGSFQEPRSARPGKG